MEFDTFYKMLTLLPVHVSIFTQLSVVINAADHEIHQVVLCFSHSLSP